MTAMHNFKANILMTSATFRMRKFDMHHPPLGLVLLLHPKLTQHRHKALSAS